MKLFIRALIHLTTGAIIAISCSKIEHPPEPDTQNRGADKQKVQQAQKWLGSNLGATKSQTVWAGMWEDAFTQERNSIETVEVPLSFLSERVYLFGDCKDMFNKTGLAKYIQNNTRLIVEYNSQTEATRGFFMTVVPSKKYIESNSFNLQNNSYLYRDKDFDGLVIYKDLTGKDVCGWQYKEGKITSYLLPAKVPQMNTKSAYLICQSEYTLYYTEWTYNNNDNVDYSNIYLEENTICWISYDDPYPNTPGGGGGGGNSNGDGGGNDAGEGGGGYPINPEIDTNKIDYKDTKSRDEFKPIIEKIAEDCAGRALLHGLGELSVEYDANMAGAFVYNTSQKKIKWNYYVIPPEGIVFHELVHAYQRQSLEVIGTSINIEVEAFLAQYKYCKKNNQELWLSLYKPIEDAFGPYVNNPTTENYQLMVDYLRNLETSDKVYEYANISKYPYIEQDKNNLSIINEIFRCY